MQVVPDRVTLMAGPAAPAARPPALAVPPREPGPSVRGVLPSATNAAGCLRPETLHPTLWFAHQVGRHAEAGVPTGYAALDLQLPGAGWPRRALTELLLPHPGLGEIRLLVPSLGAVQRAGRLVMLFDPPATLSAMALGQLGLDVEQLLVIHTRTRVVPGSDSLWALEQALKSGHVGAVVAWLPPRLRTERLRRLQLAAHAHDGPAFVFCEISAAQRPTAAPLRLALRAGGADTLALRVLKRRGPPLETPLCLALPPVLSATASQRAAVGAVPASQAAGGLVDSAYAGRRGSNGAGPERTGHAWLEPSLGGATFVNLATGR
jgi:protein ImuA